MNRKSNLDALFGSRTTFKAAQEPEQFADANSIGREAQFADANQGPALPKERRRSGAVGAMSNTLRGLAAKADAAVVIEQGSTVIELDTALIDASFITDRVTDANDESLRTLVESIRESGQHVPVLVRPHPTASGRYQIAFGRRRTLAAQILERPVRAVVRQLTDVELVIAQGNENLERRDLSYIERAFFALRMEEHGFPRETITAAMGVGKGDLSTLISVARSVPEDILLAIGPAPAAGRPRWMLLANRINIANRSALTRVMSNPAFQAKGTDDRFAIILAAVAPPAKRKPVPQVWKDDRGRKVARVERSADRVAVAFDEKIEPGLADYILGRLPELFAAYRQGKI